MDKGVIYEWGPIILFRECSGFGRLSLKIPAQQETKIAEKKNVPGEP